MSALRHPFAMFLVLLLVLRTIVTFTLVSAPVAVVLVTGCGPGVNEKAAKATMLTTNSLRDGFLAYDKEHQDKIVEAATSEEQGAKALAEYRTKRNEVADLFVAVYQAILATYTADFDEASARNLVKAFTDLKDKLDALKKGG